MEKFHQAFDGKLLVFLFFGNIREMRPRIRHKFFQQYPTCPGVPTPYENLQIHDIVRTQMSVQEVKSTVYVKLF